MATKYSFGTAVQPEMQLDERPIPGAEEVVRIRPVPPRQDIVTILVLGRSGSGKTHFVNTVYSDIKLGERKYPGTTDARSYHLIVSGVRFRLVDTPGFDNMVMSDVEVFTKIADYLLHPSRVGGGINGVIYIHRAGDTLRSRALFRNLTVLSKIFLGETGLSRLTIFVSQAGLQQVDLAVVDAEIKDPTSAFSKACALGARVVTSKVDQRGSLDTIMQYASEDSFPLPIQQKNPPESCSNFAVRVEEALGYYERESVQQRVAELKKNLQQSSETKVQELHAGLEEKNVKLRQYYDAYKHSQQLVIDQQEEGATLRQQLRQTQQEYSSLRSQLQLQDNFEQSNIVQDLKDLNRDIDNIGRAISVYLVDNYVRAVFGKAISDVTSLDARNLSELKTLLRQVEGKASLVESTAGVGMDVESFFDFSIRAMLCTLLATKIFQRFHPAIDLLLSKTLNTTYLDIQKQEPQSISGKWRSSTFKNIYKPEKPDAVISFIDKVVHDFTQERLNPFITYFFGRKNVTLERQHFNHLHQLVRRAWDWNLKLKGEVIMLGDFVQRSYMPCSTFNPTLMEEFEPNPRKKAKTILCTIALGLLSRKAVGGGQPPEETMVCKPLVVTDGLYA